MSAKFYPGDRFEDQDKRRQGRVLVVRETFSFPTGYEYLLEVEAHPDASLVGRETVVTERTLLDKRRYRKVDR